MAIRPYLAQMAEVSRAPRPFANRWSALSALTADERQIRTNNQGSGHRYFIDEGAGTLFKLKVSHCGDSRQLSDENADTTDSADSVSGTKARFKEDYLAARDPRAHRILYRSRKYADSLRYVAAKCRARWASSANAPNAACPP